MSKMSRRDLIKGMGAVGMLAMAGPLVNLSSCAVSPSGTSSPENTASTGNPSTDCVLTPEETEGPYYIQSSQVRQDISEGRPGQALRLVLTVLNANTCQPIPDAMVDIWHADAEGVYSAYPGQSDSRSLDTTGKTFLRGVQVTGSNGQASFTSIYPGWYRGRTTHIHFKIHFNNSTRVTSQLYFPETVSTAVYTAHSAYKARGDKDTPNGRDMIFVQTSGSGRLLLKVEKQGDSYVASNTIGIAVA
ncbi:MAG: intradiol ring-cleavage dioxygenase [Candidatus Sericytochromatia bacterium]